MFDVLYLIVQVHYFIWHDNDLIIYLVVIIQSVARRWTAIIKLSFMQLKAMQTLKI